MNKKRKRRMIMVGIIFLSVAAIVALITYALKQNINLFYTPTQIAEQQAPVNLRIRVGGLVKVGSVEGRQPNTVLQFQITDLKETLVIQYSGLLPDLFREGQGIIALGRLQPNGIFKAEEILAKHDENYMPPEVADSLKTSTSGKP